MLREPASDHGRKSSAPLQEDSAQAAAIPQTHRVHPHGHRRKHGQRNFSIHQFRDEQASSRSLTPTSTNLNANPRSHQYR